MKKIVLALAAMIATMGAAQAQDAAPAPERAPLRFMVGMGLSGGGDKLVAVEYTNGDSYNIKSGGLIYLTGAADYRVSPEFSIQGTLNYHVDRANAKNGDIKFQRFPIEVLGYYHLNNAWRLGGGVRYVTGAKLSGSGAASDLDVKFDNTTSAVLETEYFFNQNFAMKLRYVKETYKTRGYEDVNADHVGLSGNFYF